MSEQSRMVMGAAFGALCGAALAYLFFTDRGRSVRDRLEPALDGLRGEFVRFQKALEKVGDLANDGLRVVEEFKTARGRYPSDITSH